MFEYLFLVFINKADFLFFSRVIMLMCESGANGVEDKEPEISLSICKLKVDIQNDVSGHIRY